MEEAAAKAAQFSKDISLLLERKEKDKSWGRRECKGPVGKIHGARASGPSAAATIR
jgi:hypothetical protein